MPDFKFKFQMYKHLQEKYTQHLLRGKKAADEIGIPKDLRGKFGLTGSIASRAFPKYLYILFCHCEEQSDEAIP
jgi:hypothetical protein